MKGIGSVRGSSSSVDFHWLQEGLKQPLLFFIPCSPLSSCPGEWNCSQLDLALLQGQGRFGSMGASRSCSGSLWQWGEGQRSTGSSLTVANISIWDGDERKWQTQEYLSRYWKYERLLVKHSEWLPGKPDFSLLLWRHPEETTIWPQLMCVQCIPPPL